MFPALQRPSAWKKQGAPLWVAAVLACAGVADVAHSAWSLYRLGHVPAAAFPARRQPGPADDRASGIQQLVNAHLFGVAPADAQPGSFAGDALPSARDLALSGVIAMPDPADGYAMLGRKGQPTRLYHAGAALQEFAGGRLYQVFADHVVLELSGLFETLTLPKSKLRGRRARLLAQADSNEADKAPASGENKQQLVSAAQTLFADLNAEQNNVGGHVEGMLLHPSRAYQRSFGVRDGDVLTSVNGVAITDPGALNQMLQHTDNRTLTLTYSRDGQSHTVEMGVPD